MYENLEAPVKPYRRAKPNEMLHKERKKHFEKVQRNTVDFFGAKGIKEPRSISSGSKTELCLVFALF